MRSTAGQRLAIDGGPRTRSIPFPAWPRVTERGRRALIDVLESGHWWQSGGGRAEALEEWLAAYHSTIGAVAVTNGTHALEVSLKALGIAPNSEVLVPALTFISTATAVTAIGAVPVPVDIDRDTLCIDQKDLKRKITQRSVAVVPVHLAGLPSDMSAIYELSRLESLLVIEDCAQAIGAEWKGRRVGSWGDVATISFQAAKLIAAGEGGAIIVRSDAELLERIRLLANCGRARGSKGYDHQLVGSNYRMTEFQAALILSQVDDFDDLCEVRAGAARALAQELLDRHLGIPTAVADQVTRMVWYMFVIRMTPSMLTRMTNVELAAALTAEGVPANPIYPPFYATGAYGGGQIEHSLRCPQAESAARELIWLHHSLLLDGERGVSDVVSALDKIDRQSTSWKLERRSG
jgi:3-amino-5-hydroxybenzoate synthase